MQTITKRSPNVSRGYGVCSSATWQEEGVSMGGWGIDRREEWGWTPPVFPKRLPGANPPKSLKQ